MEALLGVHLFSLKSERAHGSPLLKPESAARRFPRRDTPLPLRASLIPHPSSSAAGRPAPRCNNAGEHPKVQHRWRGLMSTFGKFKSAAKCRWRQTVLLIQLHIPPPCFELQMLSRLTNYPLILCHDYLKQPVFSHRRGVQRINLCIKGGASESRSYRQPSCSPSDPAGTCWTAARRACSPRRWEPTSCPGSDRLQMSTPPGTSRRWAGWCPADVTLASWSYRGSSGRCATGTPSAPCWGRARREACF